MSKRVNGVSFSPPLIWIVLNYTAFAVATVIVAASNGCQRLAPVGNCFLYPAARSRPLIALASACHHNAFLRMLSFGRPWKNRVVANPERVTAGCFGRLFESDYCK